MAPMSPMTALTLTPSAGWRAVARKVTSTGPMMNTTSSSMASSANAVFSNGEPFSRRVQRARTADPARLKPIPTPRAAAKLTASGQASSIAVTSSATLSTLIKTASSRTRAWPTRSVARPQSGATTAAASVVTAISNPARPKEPVVSDTSSTIPMPVIAIGSRATKPARLKATALRSESTWRYGRRSKGDDPLERLGAGELDLARGTTPLNPRGRDELSQTH